jgi:hypothetical protein
VATDRGNSVARKLLVKTLGLSFGEQAIDHAGQRRAIWGVSRRRSEATRGQ